MAEDPTAMKFLCRGVMTPKPGFEYSGSRPEIRTSEFTLAHASRHSRETFAAYQRQMRVNLNDFLHQKMNSPVSEEESQKLHFDRIWFTRNTVLEAPIAGDVYGSADLGISVKSKYRDPSALTLWRVGEDKLLYCLTQEVGRWTTQEKAAACVRMARQYPEHFKTWVIEQPSNSG